jgi:hypothetical protein
MDRCNRMDRRLRRLWVLYRRDWMGCRRWGGRRGVSLREHGFAGIAWIASHEIVHRRCVMPPPFEPRSALGRRDWLIGVPQKRDKV